MAKPAEPITIKKYANRRLYNTATSAYVTLEDLGVMVKNGEDFTVVDAKTGEDITRSVLTQIIFDEENKGPNNLLPITFLRQLIRFYGDSLQNLVPSYLEISLATLTRDQEKFREHMTNAFGGSAFSLGPVEEQVRTNMALMERALRVFTPFPTGAREDASTPATKDQPAAPAGGNAGSGAGSSEIEELKRQLGEVRTRLDKLSGGS